MLKVFIHNNPVEDTVNIYFCSEQNNERYFAKPINLEFERHENNTSIEPTIKLSGIVAPEFLKALAEALDKNNIKTENDFKIQGLLEATKYHLEDMRNIVFKRKE